MPCTAIFEGHLGAHLRRCAIPSLGIISIVSLVVDKLRFMLCNGCEEVYERTVEVKGGWLEPRRGPSLSRELTTVTLHTFKLAEGCHVVESPRLRRSYLDFCRSSRLTCTTSLFAKQSNCTRIQSLFQCQKPTKSDANSIDSASSLLAGLTRERLPSYGRFADRMKNQRFTHTTSMETR